MPEQLTKHPDVTLQVLRSSGAQCGQGAPQDILTRCPAERFCKLPGGEICIFGLSDAPRMTQITAADWRTLVQAVPAEKPPSGAVVGVEVWLGAGIGLLAGAVIGMAVSRSRHPRH